jgi:transcriptional regulator with XRE-family HTH domain
MRKTVRRDTGSISTNDRSPVDTILGKLMRERREYVGFSRKGLARKLGLTKRAIKQYEDGDIYFGMDVIALLRLALKVRVGYFADPISPVARKVGVQHHGQR